MPVKFLSRLLFPRLPAWQARRQVRHLLAALAVAMFLGAVIAAILLLQAYRR